MRGSSAIDYWKAIMDSGRAPFWSRVGSNVRLLKDLGYAPGKVQGLVYPLARTGRPPSVCPHWSSALVVVHDGRKPCYLVTSVCDDKRALRPASGTDLPTSLGY